MANGPYTVTTAEKHIDEVWEVGTIDALEFECKLGNLVDKSWKFVGHGDVYHKPRFPNIAVQTKTADTDLTPTTYTDTEQTITINVHQACAIKVENIVSVLSRDDVKSHMSQKMGYALGRAVDVAIAALAQNFSQVVGTLGADPSYDDLLDVVGYLEDAGYIPSENCNLVISTQMRRAMMKIDQFIHSDYRGEGNAVKASTRGEIGTWQGLPIITHQFLRAPAAGQHESFAFHKESIAVIMAENQKTTVETIALAQSDVVVKANIYGLAEINRYSEAAGNITATDEGCVLFRGK